MIPPFDTLAMESDVRMVLGDMSRAGCGCGLPRIAHLQKCALDAAILVPHFGRALLWHAHRGERRVLGA